jgi:hypothetical protein
MNPAVALFGIERTDMSAAGTNQNVLRWLMLFFRKIGLNSKAGADFQNKSKQRSRIDAFQYNPESILNCVEQSFLFS